MTPAAQVHGALFLVAVLFGVNYIVAKFAMREVSPFTLVVLRTSGTAALLFGASGFTRRPSHPQHARPNRGLRGFTRSEYGEIFLYSLLGTTINQICFLEGLTRSTATNAAVMYVSVPLITLAFAVLMGRERASATGVAGIVIGIAGALLLIVPRGNLDLSREAVVGNVLLLAGAVSYALYLVLTRPILARHDPLRVTRWIFLFSALTVLPFGIGGLRHLSTTGLTTVGTSSILYVIVGATTLPYLFNNWALVRVQSSVVAIYILVQPVVAGTLGWIVLGERFGPHTAVAAMLVVFGVLLSSLRRQSGREPNSSAPSS